MRPALASRATAAAVLAAVFAAGMAVGGALARRAGANEPPPATVNVPSAFDQLGLTDDQRRRMDSVMERMRPRSESVLSAALPRLRALADSTDAAVREILTPAQRQRLDSILGAARIEPTFVPAPPGSEFSIPVPGPATPGPPGAGPPDRRPRP